MSAEPKLSYTVEEAARAIGCSKRQVWNMAKAGQLQTFKFAGRTLIRSDVLQTALDRASGRAAA